MKSIKGLVVLVALSGILCCGMGLAFWDGYYLPSKPCRPIRYSDGVPLGQDATTVVPDSLETVVTYYDKTLDAQPSQNSEPAVWRTEKLNNGYLYWCYSADINLLTAETGCIYVLKNDVGTSLEYRLRRSEGGHLTCPPK
jgi:hypothetical protein